MDNSGRERGICAVSERRQEYQRILDFCEPNNVRYIVGGQKKYYGVIIMDVPGIYQVWPQLYAKHILRDLRGDAYRK